MILTDADELREALRVALEERDQARRQAGEFTRILLREGDAEGACERQLAEAFRERDEARAEVERLRADLSYAERERDRWMGQVRTVAERQREACAAYMDRERWYTSRAALSAPLVTEGEP